MLLVLFAGSMARRIPVDYDATDLGLREPRNDHPHLERTSEVSSIPSVSTISALLTFSFDSVAIKALKRKQGRIWADFSGGGPHF